MPSTFRSATLGGLYGGGFGGVGSINYGPLASTGNVLGVRAMSIEPEPKVVELRAPEALLLHHVYGTNGLVLELEVGLAPAHPWLEAIVCFDSFDAALEFGDALASAPGIVKKSVTLLAAPIPDLLLQAVPPLAGTMTAGAHAVFVLVAEFSEAGLQQTVAQFGGTVTLPQDRGRGAGQQPHHRRIHLEPHHAARDEGGQGPDLHPERLPGRPARAAGQGHAPVAGRRGAGAPGVHPHQGRRDELLGPAAHPLPQRRAAEPDHADPPRPRRVHRQPACLHRRGRQAGPGQPRRGGHQDALRPAGPAEPGQAARLGAARADHGRCGGRAVSLSTLPSF